ncbi:uncharacterized protein N7484_002912 [Penicillium longicatenatum]|uniref:uncharacterized protein n=1 Tax=Penicillium longicatenatum TaxID=1561947 RepID=UPI002548240F|nr:uncharacterized protein N7484_002912 [Penicillium longicatenatum]KAJ5649189.1 hypothetical protein N7484_002912 [Penicillium longicatenatum]
MSQQPEHVIRLTLQLKKREEMTDAQFLHHCTNVHGLLVSPWLRRHMVIKGAQDGHVQLYVPSLDCIANALDDPFYKDVVIADEDNSIWAKYWMWTVEYGERVMVNCEVVENPPLTGRVNL